MVDPVVELVVVVVGSSHSVVTLSAGPFGPSAGVPGSVLFTCFGGGGGTGGRGGGLFGCLGDGVIAVARTQTNANQTSPAHLIRFRAFLPKNFK